jgi:MoaA/NifB/PqqE/SkfB family radical SAM enzyme
LYELLAEKKVRHWQVHLCQMTGRAAAHRANLMCRPGDLEKIMRVLQRAAREKKVLAPLHCTVGYLTKEEPVLRPRRNAGSAGLDGCEAGRRTLAITPAGGREGLHNPADEFVTASLPEVFGRHLADDACFPYTRRWSPEVLGGDCAYCTFAHTCRAGCPPRLTPPSARSA